MIVLTIILIIIGGVIVYYTIKPVKKLSKEPLTEEIFNTVKSSDLTSTDQKLLFKQSQYLKSIKNNMQFLAWIRIISIIISTIIILTTIIK